MIEKTWTYAEITAKAEKRIKELMAEANQCEHENHKIQSRSWAHGVYLAWCEITRGHMDLNDEARLAALCSVAG